MLVLNLGCGVNRRRLYSEPFPEGTLHVDRNSEVGPDIVADLNFGVPPGRTVGEAFQDFWNKVDEIHAYHVVEHLGTMGDTKVWFDFWRSCWQVLKPGGLMYVVAPHFQHEDAIGDPTHTRLICRQTFHFFDRRAYLQKDGERGCAMSKLPIDFDFQVLETKYGYKDGENRPNTIAVVLVAVKDENGALLPLETEKQEIKA
jgi:hypothetical protein